MSRIKSHLGVTSLIRPRINAKQVRRAAASGRLSRCLSAATVVGALSGALAVGAQPAAALTYQIDKGPYDMRAYVSTPTDVVGCGAGNVYMSGLTVRNPFNYGFWVYPTYNVERWSGSDWYSYRSGSVKPNGVYVAPGASVPIDRNAVPSSAGYYRASMQVDFHVYGGSYDELGAVKVLPNLASDWSSNYRYQGPGYSYCWHG